MPRYLAVAVSPNAPPIDARDRETIARNPDLNIVRDEAHFLLAVSPDLACHLLGEDRGMVLGRLESRAAAASSGTQTVLGSMAASDVTAAWLTGRAWGDYVALLRDPVEHVLTVLRAPFGRLPCLHAWHKGHLLIASDVATMKLAGLPAPSVDPLTLACKLSYSELPSRKTCLTGISNLRGGSSIRLSAGELDERENWTPWRHAGRRHWATSKVAAATSLRSAVLRAVKGCRGEARKPLLLLSGGLDSSVLAASLAALGGGFGALNLVRLGGSGDERDYARAVTAHLGCELIEAEWRIEDVDVTRSHVADQPDPTGRSFMQATAKLLAQAVGHSQADLVIDGGGGDNVFFNLASVAPVTDALIHGESMATGWQTAASIARMAQTSIADVLAKAILRSFRRSPAFRMQPRLALLSAAAIDQVPKFPPHPWLDSPPRAETGTAAQVAAIAAAQSWAEANDLGASVEHRSPLTTQPVIEACLAVPSWWWFEDGINRAIARKAFAERLPQAVLNRRAKGAPDGFMADIYTRNRGVLRAMLLDGRLRQLGLIDLAAIEQATSNVGPPTGSWYHRILQLADAEAWLRAQA